MTRRSSVRAQARRIYRDSKQAKAADPSSLRFDGQAPTPDPSPRFAGARGGGENDLTERVRALYEDSAVPVREIAAVAGVTERTIYKYAAKHRWKMRYRWAPHHRWRAAPEVAPVKGAGGRFVRREDKGKPFARGLKALDPAAAAQALAASAAAERAARLAQAEADAELATDALCRAIDCMRAATRELADYVSEQQARGKASPTRINELRERVLFMACDCSVNQVDHTVEAWQRAQLRARAGSQTE